MRFLFRYTKIKKILFCLSFLGLYFKYVVIDSTMDTSKRLKDFAAKIKNPYCYICNGIIVKMSYSNNGPSLSELIKDSIQAKIG